MPTTGDHGNVFLAVKSLTQNKLQISTDFLKRIATSDHYPGK